LLGYVADINSGFGSTLIEKGLVHCSTERRFERAERT
jgi:hypothetical protein